MKRFFTLTVLGALLTASAAFGAVINPYSTTSSFGSASELSGATFSAVEQFNATSTIFNTTSTNGAVSGGLWVDRVNPVGPATTTFSLVSGASMLGVVGLWDLTPGGAGSNIVITIKFADNSTQTLTQVLGGNTGNYTAPFTFGFTSSQAFVSFTLSAGNAGGLENFTLDNLQAAAVTSIPEPGTFALAGLAMVGLGLVRRARR